MTAVLGTIRRMVTHDDAHGWLHEVVWAVIEQESRRRGVNISTLSINAGLHRATSDRLRTGKPVSKRTLWQIEGALGLPRDFLTYVGTGDTALIEATTADPDLVRWVTQRIQSATHNRRIG